MGEEVDMLIKYIEEMLKQHPYGDYVVMSLTKDETQTVINALEEIRN